MATGNIKPRSACRLLFTVLLAFNAFAQTIDEYQLKAAFLYNFAKFVEWPALTFKTDTDPMRICVLGQNPFGGALREAVAGKAVLNRSFAFGALRPTGILTVGETEGFAAQGGIVNFRLEGGRVRLEINIEAAERAKLRISSKVLSLAQIVKPGLKK
jgi:hypothetical protein